MTEIESLKDLIEKQRELDRTVDVWVQADTTKDPPHGSATAARIVAMLGDGGSGMVKITPDSQSKAFERGDVIWYLLQYDRFHEQWSEARKSLNVSRAFESPVVIQADDVPRQVKELIDVKVVVTEDSAIGPVYRLQRDVFGGEQYQVQMSGIT